LEKQLKHDLDYLYSTLYEKFPWAFLPVNSVIEEVVAEMKGYSVG
jgi:hypothetical protein